MKKNAQSVEAWLEAMIAVARYYRLDFSQENVRATVNWERDSKREELLTDMARQLGMGLRLVEFSADSLNPWRLPLIAVFDNQQIGVITRRDNHDNISVQFSGDEGLETTLNVADIEDKIVELALLRPLSAIPDARVDDYIRPYQAKLVLESFAKRLAALRRYYAGVTGGERAGAGGDDFLDAGLRSGGSGAIVPDAMGAFRRGDDGDPV